MQTPDSLAPVHITLVSGRQIRTVARMGPMAYDKTARSERFSIENLEAGCIILSCQLRREHEFPCDLRPQRGRFKGGDCEEEENDCSARGLHDFSCNINPSTGASGPTEARA